MIRDEHAITRTHLANERTVLAYIRTALAVMATGAGLISFISSTLAFISGWSFIGIGCVIFFIGIARFITTRRQINNSSLPKDNGLN